MRTVLFLTIFLLGNILGMRPSSAAPENGSGRIPSVTRLVQQFTQLEGKLAEALGKRDRTAVAGLLADDFEMRTAAMPGAPVPRDPWIRQSLAEPVTPAIIEQMAVHDFGGLAVVSYARSDKAATPKAGRDIFIVDIWKQDADDWKLTIRYAGPASKGVFPFPGVPATTPPFEKKE